MNNSTLKKSATYHLDKDLHAHLEGLAKKKNQSVNSFIETVLSEATDYCQHNEVMKVNIFDARKERASLKRFDNVQQLLAALKID